MAPRVRLSLDRDAVWWPALGLALAAAALAVALVPALWGGHGPGDAWAWRREHVLTEPWRLWSAALVHLDRPHLLANLAGALVVAAYGWAAGCGRAQTLAWAVAWPLGHALLGFAPAVQTLWGMSGVLHAGVAVAVVHGLLGGRGAARWIGAVTGVGLLAKLWLESPWVAPLRTDPGWDFPVVVMAHATGVAAGAAAAVVAWATSRRRTDATMPG